MRKLSLIGGIAAIALIPTFALAQQTCEQQKSNRVVGTVGGGIVGALLGSAVAGHGEKGTGAVVGGVAGAVIGNQVTKPNADCQHAYGYYDRNGAWHATNVDASNAAGYYDRDGNWVDGAPNGRYDSSGRWVSASNDSRGYRDANGRWVPGSVDGYYDVDGRYVTATRAQAMADNRRADSYGEYDRNGQWRPSGAAMGQAHGYYDRNGQWVVGAPGGGYDANGRWDVNASSAGAYGSDTSFNGHMGGMGPGGSDWAGAGDIRSREAWLDQRIRAGAADGSLTRYEANRSLRTLSGIRMEERRLTNRHRGLTAGDQAYIQGKLDALRADVRAARHNGN